MENRWGRRLEYAVLGLAFLAIPAAILLFLEVISIPRFDSGSLSGLAIGVAAVLVLAAIALPAYILSGWQSAERAVRGDATSDRNRRDRP